MPENFIPPKLRVTEAATKKHIEIIESLIPALAECSTAVLLTGSMAYGQDYSVTPESDINLQLTITPEIFPKLASCKYFQKYNLTRIGQWFTEGIFQTFILNFIHKEISVECRFWNEAAYKEILLYKRESFVRLGSQTKKTSLDNGYSFDGEENTTTCPDYKEGIYNVWMCPVYRIKSKKVFLSRPLTDVLGNAIVLFDSCGLSEIINECRAMTEEKITETKQEKWKTYTIFNTLQRKNKVAEEVKIMLI